MGRLKLPKCSKCGRDIDIVELSLTEQAEILATSAPVHRNCNEQSSYSFDWDE